ncbi:MAG TPA: pyridoxamine 5'-phosphate oxidase family protein [Alphaproteobacteria bacterium]|nr:pyridoxamine 5'-phosphate oxidase family protein [Alphaproteobacteria bacterium]
MELLQGPTSLYRTPTKWEFKGHMDGFTPTPKTRVKRLPKRGHYDRETIHGILDAGVVCHVGYLIDDQPYVTPTTYWREGDQLYWHGSSASRMIRALKRGVRVCFTVTHIDGFVLARSGFHHSVNYRSVMAFGTASAVTEEKEKLAALEHFVERLFPGRWPELRPPTAQEMKATTVLAMDLDKVSAKIRTGPPVDDEEDYALPCWAGVLPLSTAAGVPEPDPRLRPDIGLPDYLRDQPSVRSI